MRNDQQLIHGLKADTGEWQQCASCPSCAAIAYRKAEGQTALRLTAANSHKCQRNCESNVTDWQSQTVDCTKGNTLSNRGVTGGTRIALGYETIRNLLIPLPLLTIQQTIAAEVARHLREQASTGWQAAKAQFEAQLLGA